MAEERKKLTVPDLRVRKKAGEKVVMASIPDYPSAIWAERAGIDIAAVGDSLGMVSYGHPNTLPVTVRWRIGANSPAAKDSRSSAARSAGGRLTTWA